MSRPAQQVNKQNKDIHIDIMQEIIVLLCYPIQVYFFLEKRHDGYSPIDRGSDRPRVF